MNRRVYSQGASRRRTFRTALIKIAFYDAPLGAQSAHRAGPLMALDIGRSSRVGSKLTEQSGLPLSGRPFSVFKIEESRKERKIGGVGNFREISEGAMIYIYPRVHVVSKFKRKRGGRARFSETNFGEINRHNRHNSLLSYHFSRYFSIE